MRIRWSEYILWSAASAMLGGGMVALGWAAAGLTDPAPAAGVRGIVKPAGGEQATASALPPLDEFAHIWQTNVRHRLDGTDSSPDEVITTAGTEAPQTLRSRLVATALDGEHSRAIFYDEQGSPLVRSVGELVDGLSITAIERDTVKLGTGVELKVPEQYGMWP